MPKVFDAPLQLGNIPLINLLNEFRIWNNWIRSDQFTSGGRLCDPRGRHRLQSIRFDRSATYAVRGSLASTSFRARRPVQRTDGSRVICAFGRCRIPFQIG
jgi:hypothetical protein